MPQSNRDCPNCATASFVIKHVNGVDVERCGTCRGNWFDAGELERVLPVAIQELAIHDDAADSKRLCPACEIPMREFYYPQTYVNIDMCPRCRGLWLEKGEYREIKAVRELRDQKGELQEVDDVPGAKGKLLAFIEEAIGKLVDI